jgi:YggT family protein
VLFFQILGFALFIFWLLLIARVVVEFIRSFSRDWRPTGITVVILEIILSITDPPVKLLRRLIPQLTIGAVRFDLSIMVLLLVAFIGMQLAFGAAACAAPPVSAAEAGRRFGHVLASVWCSRFKNFKDSDFIALNV